MGINTKLFKPSDNATWRLNLMVVPVRCEGVVAIDSVVIVPAETYKQARAKAAMNQQLAGCDAKHTPLTLGKKER